LIDKRRSVLGSDSLNKPFLAHLLGHTLEIGKVHLIENVPVAGALRPHDFRIQIDSHTKMVA